MTNAQDTNKPAPIFGDLGTVTDDDATPPPMSKDNPRCIAEDEGPMACPCDECRDHLEQTMMDNIERDGYTY